MRKLFEDYIKEISKEEIVEQYIENNKSSKECAEYFNITESMFYKILAYYRIHKPTNLHTEQIKKSKLEHFGDENYNNHQQTVETCRQKYGVENVFQDAEVKARCAEIKLEKYGDEHFTNIEKGMQTRINNCGSIEESYKQQYKKYTETCIKKYGVSNIALSDEIRKQIQKTQTENWNDLSEEEKAVIAKKISDSNIGIIPWNKDKKLGKIEEPKKTNILRKQYETKRANNSFNTSTPEDEYYKILVEIYGEEAVIRQYSSDSRYPFACDFYIIPKDLFIELNLNWTHGGPPYNPNSEEDRTKLEMWKERAKESQHYLNAIETWTVRDVLKHQAVIENNLNYIEYYTEKELFE